MGFLDLVSTVFRAEVLAEPFCFVSLAFPAFLDFRGLNFTSGFPDQRNGILLCEQCNGTAIKKNSTIHNGHARQAAFYKNLE